MIHPRRYCGGWGRVYRPWYPTHRWRGVASTSSVRSPGWRGQRRGWLSIRPAGACGACQQGGQSCPHWRACWGCGRDSQSPAEPPWRSQRQTGSMPLQQPQSRRLSETAPSDPAGCPLVTDRVCSHQPMGLPRPGLAIQHLRPVATPPLERKGATRGPTQAAPRTCRHSPAEPSHAAAGLCAALGRRSSRNGRLDGHALSGGGGQVARCIRRVVRLAVRFLPGEHARACNGLAGFAHSTPHLCQ